MEVSGSRALLMAADFDPSANSLAKASYHVFEGAIFINLADEPGAFGSHYADLRNSPRAIHAGRQFHQWPEFMDGG